MTRINNIDDDEESGNQRITYNLKENKIRELTHSVTQTSYYIGTMRHLDNIELT